MTWHNQYFVDFTLPFDLRSAPFIFYSVANMVRWILQHRYQVRYLFHYLDDFLTLGAAASNECAENIGITKVVFARLGLPLHPSKCEGRTTILVFLGIESWIACDKLLGYPRENVWRRGSFFICGHPKVGVHGKNLNHCADPFITFARLYLRAVRSCAVCLTCYVVFGIRSTLSALTAN